MHYAHRGVGRGGKTSLRSSSTPSLLSGVSDVAPVLQRQRLKREGGLADGLGSARKNTSSASSSSRRLSPSSLESSSDRPRRLRAVSSDSMAAADAAQRLPGWLELLFLSAAMVAEDPYYQGSRLGSVAAAASPIARLQGCSEDVLPLPLMFLTILAAIRVGFTTPLSSEPGVLSEKSVEAIGTVCLTASQLGCPFLISRVPPLLQAGRKSGVRLRTVVRAMIAGIRAARSMGILRRSPKRSRSDRRLGAGPGMQVMQAGRWTQVSYPIDVHQQLSSLRPGARREMLKAPDVPMHLECAYGYNGHVRQNLLLVSSYEVCYNVAGVAVIFDFEERRQRFFTCGTTEISALAHSPYTGLVASGLRLSTEHRAIERKAHQQSRVFEQTPHVWVWRTRDCRAIASCVGDYGDVAALAFSDDGLQLLGVIVENGRSMLYMWDTRLAAETAMASHSSRHDGSSSPSGRRSQPAWQSVATPKDTAGPLHLNPALVLQPMLRTAFSVNEGVEGLVCRPDSNLFLLQGRTSLLFWQWSMADAEPSSCYAEFKPFCSPESGRYSITTAAFLLQPLDGTEGAEGDDEEVRGLVAACGTSDGFVILFSGSRAYRQLEAANRGVAVTCIMPTPDGGFACGARDGVITVFNSFGDASFHFPLDATGSGRFPLNAMCVLRKDVMMVGTTDHELVLVDLREADVTVERVTKSSEVEMRALAVNPQAEQCIVVGDRIGRLLFYDTEVARLLPRLTHHNLSAAGRPVPVCSLDWSPSGHILAVGLEDGRCKLLKTVLVQGEAGLAGSPAPEVVCCVPVASEAIHDIMFEPISGHYLAVASRTVTILRVAYNFAPGRSHASTIGAGLKGAQLLRHTSLRGTTSAVLKLQFSQDGAHIMACCRDGVIVYWEVESGERKNAIHSVRWFGLDHPYRLPFGWPVLGLWRTTFDKEFPDRSSTSFVASSDYEDNLLAVGDNDGRLLLFRFPIPLFEDTGHLELFGHSSKVTQLHWTRSGKLFSVGMGRSDCVLQWALGPAPYGTPRRDTSSLGFGTLSPKNCNSSRARRKSSPRSSRDSSQLSGFPVLAPIPDTGEPSSGRVSNGSPDGGSSLPPSSPGHDYEGVEGCSSGPPCAGSTTVPGEVTTPPPMADGTGFEEEDSAEFFQEESGPITIDDQQSYVQHFSEESSHMSMASPEVSPEQEEEVPPPAPSQQDAVAQCRPRLSPLAQASLPGLGSKRWSEAATDPVMVEKVDFGCQVSTETLGDTPPWVARALAAASSSAASSLPAGLATYPAGSSAADGAAPRIPQRQSGQGRADEEPVADDSPSLLSLQEDLLPAAFPAGDNPADPESSETVGLGPMAVRSSPGGSSSSKEATEVASPEGLTHREVLTHRSEIESIDAPPTNHDQSSHAPFVYKQQENGVGTGGPPPPPGQANDERMEEPGRPHRQSSAPAGVRSPSKEHRGLPAAPLVHTASLGDYLPASGTAAPQQQRTIIRFNSVPAFTMQPPLSPPTLRPVASRPQLQRSPNSPGRWVVVPSASPTWPANSPATSSRASAVAAGQTTAAGPSGVRPAWPVFGKDDVRAPVPTAEPADSTAGDATPALTSAVNSTLPSARPSAMLSGRAGSPTLAPETANGSDGIAGHGTARSQSPPAKLPPWMSLSQSKSTPQLTTPQLLSSSARPASPVTGEYRPATVRTWSPPTRENNSQGDGKAGHPTSARILSPASAARARQAPHTVRYASPRPQLVSPAALQEVRTPSIGYARPLSPQLLFRPTIPTTLQRSPRGEPEGARPPHRGQRSYPAVVRLTSAPIVDPTSAASSSRVPRPGAEQALAATSGLPPGMVSSFVARAPAVAPLAREPVAVVPVGSAGRAHSPSQLPASFVAGAVRRIEPAALQPGPQGIPGIRVWVVNDAAWQPGSGPMVVTGDLFAYRPPQWTDLSEAIVYGDTGLERIRLPPQWLVFRPADGPLLWLRLHSPIDTPLRGRLMMQWGDISQASDGSLAGIICAELCGEVPDLMPLGPNEALVRLRADPNAPQGKAKLGSSCSHIFRQWLRHAQQAGVAI
eukprot:TRINITY_DN50904_c0_g1_i1.p1 TRINITY_DN50904_c0_g1~~TRINITY_DN50904_c0_g1_i1.p1  ORF type:complete len:2042 (-),score=299.70 TRINITY_DN50904_c0_g1_i1:77-6202(-)